MITSKHKKLILITLFIVGLAFISSAGAVSAADNQTTTDDNILAADNSLSGDDNTAADDNSTSEENSTTINGEVDQCGSTDPFSGVIITVTELDGTVMGSALTDANGNYQVTFISEEDTFNVTASYPGHISPTKQVTVNSQQSGTVNFQLGTLGLTKGSTDIIGLDSNNVNDGPNHFMIQIHVTNNSANTALNVTGTLAFTSANANIILDPTDTAVKSLGDIAPGETVDLFYLINVNRTNAAYFTSRNYTITVQGTNTGSADTITGSLYVEKLISQNRNQVVSIVVTPPNPTLGSNFAVTVTSTTASATYNWVDLSLVNYNASIIQPVSVNITYGANNTNSILINNPGTTVFVSQWIFKAVGAGATPLAALIMDNSGSSYHYNSDFTDANIINVTPEADLAVTKTVNNTTPNVGDNVTFTITATNLGPNNATGVTVNDLLPAGLSFVSANPSVGSYSNLTGVWTIGNLAVNAVETLTIVATVMQPGLIVNIAHIQGNEDDPNPLNNEDSAALNGESADLILTKEANDLTPCIEDDVTFTINIFNAGPSDAANVTVNDLLPAGLSLVSANPSTGTYNTITGVWTIGTLVHATGATLTLVATATQTGIITNTAEAFTTTYDPTTPNTASATIDVQPCADLAVIKTVNNTSPNVGQNVTFTITATNLGPSNATGVKVNDLIPAGLSLVSANASLGSYNSVTGVWTIGNLAVNAVETLTIVATVMQTGQITNIADISGNEEDPNLLNNQDIAVINGEPTADLAIVKTVDNNQPFVGDNVTFTINVFNAGPNDATGTVVNDILPAGLSFVSANPSVGTYNDITGVWTIGTLLHSTGAVMTIIATVTEPGFFTNIATVSSEVYDPHPEDNTSSVTVNALPSADLAIIKTVNDTTPNVGDNITYTITATNNGPNNATGVTVTDNLPAGLTFVSANASVGSYNSLTGVWTIGNLAVSAIETLTIIATVNQVGQIDNIAIIAGNEHDPNPLNNQDIAVINGEPTADLAILKTVDNPTPYLGENVTFTINVFNAGPNDAENVTVNDLLPAGLQFVSANPSVGSYNSGTGVWIIGTLAHQASATLEIVATVMQTGIMTNTATVTSTTHDPHPEDNSSSTTVNGQASADLAVTKTVNNSTPNLGDIITFTITATNNGPSNATGVTVNDLLPAGLSFVSANPSVGSYNSLTGVWTIGNLSVNAVEFMTLNAMVTASNSMLENVAVIAGNEHDPNPSNNSDVVIVNSQPAADLGIVKTVNKSVVCLYNTIIFTLTVTNNGPDTAVNAYVFDILPDGFSYISSNASTGLYNPNTGIWTIGDMLNGEVETLSITARAIKMGVYVNTAVVDSETFDPNRSNNSSSVTVKVVRPCPPCVQGKTIPMQPTGTPLIPLFMAVLLVLGGLIRNYNQK